MTYRTVHCCVCAISPIRAYTRTYEGMGLGARRKAIQRDCERVRGFTLPGRMARLGEALEKAEKKRTKKKGADM